MNCTLKIIVSAISIVLLSGIIMRDISAVDAPHIPDLVIEEIRSEPENPLSGDMVDVLVTVLNQGAGEARPGILVGAQRGVGGGYFLRGVIEGGLGPDERGTVNMGRWRILARQDPMNDRWIHNELEVMVDDRNFIHEFNENNNISFADFDFQIPGNEERHEDNQITGADKLILTGIKLTLLQVRSPTPAAEGTNPFDFREVEQDIDAARQPEDESDTYPVVLTATFTSPYMVFPGSSIYLPIESGGAGTNTLGDLTSASGKGSALRIENQFDEMLNSFINFFAVPGWTIISQTVSNPVPAANVNIVVRRDSDNTYFKITTNMEASASGIDIFSLSGFNCGPSQANCP